MKQTAEEIKKISLEIQKKAADLLNSGKKPYIASRVYVDYMDMIVEGFEKAMEEHASNELASYKAELSKLIDSCEYEFLDGDWYHKDDGDGANPIKTLTLLALLEDNPTEK